MLLLLLLLSLHADLASLPHPLLEEKKVAQQVVEHVLQGIFHFSHSALSSLSLIFILRPGGSFIGIMFPRRSLFRFLFAAVNTHVVAKNMLVCVLYGYNDRLKKVSFILSKGSAATCSSDFKKTIFSYCLTK